MPEHSWGRDYVADVLELKSRNIRRKLSKDAQIICIARTCGKKPRRDDFCYYPSRTTSSGNKIIGHVECIDRACAEYTAKESAAAHGVAGHSTIEHSRKVARPRFESKVDASKAFPPKTLDEVKLDMMNFVSTLKEQRESKFSEDYQRGFRDAWAEIKSLLSEGKAI